MRLTDYDPDARELCLALARVCEFTGSWEGSRILRHAAEYLYRKRCAELIKMAKGRV